LVPVGGETWKKVVDALLGLAPAGAQAHEAGVDRDPMEPRRELRPAGKGPDRPVGGKEGVLDGVSGVLLVAQEAPGNRKEPSPLPRGPATRRRCRLPPATGQASRSRPPGTMLSRPIGRPARSNSVLPLRSSMRRPRRRMPRPATFGCRPRPGGFRKS